MAAWAELGLARAEPAAIQRLQRKAKASVFRLEGAGPGGSDVIAKRSSPERILHEQTIYEHVLPALPVPTARYYGCVEKPGDQCSWLFLEDAAGDDYSPVSEDHRALAARWLGLLHTSATRVPAAAARMPDRGPGYYLAHLRSACELIPRSLGNPVLAADDVIVLNALLRQCDVVASRWSEVELRCAALPRTFIHGDFAPKNMRVRAEPAGHTLLPFDWGSAGWGVAAADLARCEAANCWSYWANPDLATYCSVVRETWPGLGLDDARAAAAVGKVFRCLVCIRLSAESLTTPWVARAVQNMRTYSDEMADATRALAWTAGGGK